MSEQINETYFAWLNKRIDKYEPPSREEVWNAATAEANKCIAKFESEVAAFEAISFVQMKQIDELQASNKRLREALLASDDLLRKLPNSGGFYGLAIMENNQLVLSATPAESLQAHDDELLERAAKICDEHADDPVYCGDAIRALKGK